jgi:HD superfamily phosphohydrolase YqeK
MDNLQLKISEIYSALEDAGKHHTARHSDEVCEKALSICEHRGMEENIRLACALHDISVIIPKDNWIDTCSEKGIKLIKEEIELPLLAHQKLSAAIAQDRFHISDKGILSAISCHTTLKPNASYLDLVVFIADKIAWDGSGLATVNYGLNKSLHHAAYNYMQYVTDHRLLIVPHPLFISSYQWLSDKID